MSKGFSTTNLWYIKKWYLFYYQCDVKLHQLGGEIPEVLFSIPWKHHCVIITKCKKIDEALFYFKQTVDNILKKEDDNSTIGLLICQGKDDTKVKWSFKGIETPMGIAEYRLRNENYKLSLPTIEELETELFKKQLID